ncbi:MAG: uridine diphosphate-N-acetylglucosamine-binding protein YvcK [Bacillota bacterium]
MKGLYWLYPGLGIKRWFLLFALGAVATAAGVIRLLSPVWLALGGLIAAFREPGVAAAVVLLGAGAGLVTLSVVWGSRAVRRTVLKDSRWDLVEYHRQRQAKKGPRIVVIGGGTGLATLLRGLKEYTSNLTAIVTVSDDGGSSGRLREDMGMLPPGDIRNCLLALADTEPVMERLFQHRFEQGRELAGHNFGNLFIAAMTELSGDFEQAIQLFSQVLAVRGRVLPSTLSNVRLRAVFADGSSVVGETAISSAGKPIVRVELDPPCPPPLPEALEAMAAADAIILGPGSLYTSVIPNLLVSGMAAALQASAALKVYICNVMTQPGETGGYRAPDHVRAVLELAGEGSLDLVIMNDEAVPPGRLPGYIEQGASPVLADPDGVRALGVRPLCAPLLSRTGLVRHDPERLARAVILAIIDVKSGLGRLAAAGWRYRVARS